MTKKSRDRRKARRANKMKIGQPVKLSGKVYYKMLLSNETRSTGL